MTNSPEDDEYTRATKAVVDDTMRIDVLGPYVLKVLKEHHPIIEHIKDMVIASIKNDSKVQKALEDAVTPMIKKYMEDKGTARKQFWIPTIIAIIAALGAVAAVVFK